MITITEEFKELVASDVRGDCTEDQLDILIDSRREWLIVLNKLKRDVEVQLVAQKARMTAQQADCLESGTKIEWLRYRANEERWRVGAIRFMVSVEDRMRYVKNLPALQKEFTLV